MPITAKQNTVMRGNRPCSHNSVTTPMAAPKPSAVISTPNAALPPSSTSLAKLGPSGIIAPAPIRPNAEAEHHAADERVLRDELQSFLDLAEGLGPVDPLVARACRGAGSGGGRRSTADTRNVHRVER